MIRPIFILSLLFLGYSLYTYLNKIISAIFLRQVT